MLEKMMTKEESAGVPQMSENMVRKEENDDWTHFLLFTHVFQKPLLYERLNLPFSFGTSNSL